MSIEKEIISAFPEVLVGPLIEDGYIVNNQNIMEIENDFNYFKVVPVYMLWCIKNMDCNLVDMFTINALAEYGRTKIIDNNYFNFMHRCNDVQKHAVVNFLNWCSVNIDTADTTQIERALKNWSK